MISKSQILFRCITKKELGFGHLRRCLILSKELQKKKCSIQFVIDNNKDAKKILEQQNFTYFQLKNNISLKQEFTEICRICKKEKTDIVILDARERNESLSKFLSNNTIFTVVIDDAWCKYAYANLVFNPTIVKKFHKYIKTKNNYKIFYGIKYFITDKNFYNSQKKIKEIKEKNNYNITISMGGSDHDNLTYIIAKSLLELKNINIKIVIGPYFSHCKKLDKLSQNKNIHIVYSPKKLWEIFSKSDIVISNAGSTLYELAIQKIPTLYVATEKHQINYAKEFNSQNFGIYLGYKNKITSKRIKNVVEKSLNDLCLRRKMIKIRINTHINGSKVITDEILKHKKLSDANQLKYH